MQVPLAVANPHIQHVVNSHRDEPCLYFSRSRSCQPGLAAARRPIHQYATANRFAIRLVKLRMSKWMDYFKADLLLHFFHATYVLERDLRPLNFHFGRSRLIVPCGTNPALDDLTFLLPGIDSKPVGKFHIGQGPIQLDRSSIICDGFFYFPDARQQSSVKQKCPSGSVGVFDEILNNDQCMILFALLIKRACQAELEGQTIGRKSKGLAIFFLRFFQASMTE